MHLVPAKNSPAEFARFKRIGLFDSGVGGLSVLRRLSELPDADNKTFVYVGDTARCPYGNREPYEISLYVEQIVGWLQHKHVDAIVMACNTSAAMSRQTADKVAQVPVFDLIEPTARFAASLSGKIGVMATLGTTRSQAFSKAIKSLNESAEVLEYACPDLVPIVESGIIETDASRAILSAYLDQLERDGIAHVILGCTHFPFLRAQLEKLADSRLNFIDPAQILSGTHAHEYQAKFRCEVYVTGDCAGFHRAAATCLGDIHFAAESISVAELEALHLTDRFAVASESSSTAGISSVVQ